MTSGTSTPPRPGSTSLVPAFLSLAVAGFRRYATYGQATVAGAFTNSVFGFLKCYVMLAVVAAATAGGAAGGTAGGYDGPQLATFVWVGQGLLGVVLLWGWTDLADRVRTGEVTSDLLRPIDPIVSYLAADLGRAVHALLTRMLVPVVVGIVFFDLYAPHRLLTYPFTAVSVTAATVVCFAMRYLTNLAAFWLLDIRGVYMSWLLICGACSGLYFPIRFLPGWAEVVLWVATPFPALFQGPLDILVERVSLTGQLLIMADQLAWMVIALALCGWVQRRAVRKLVVQGG